MNLVFHISEDGSEIKHIKPLNIQTECFLDRFVSSATQSLEQASGTLLPITPYRDF